MEIFEAEIKNFTIAAYYGMIMVASYDILRILRWFVKHRNILIGIEDYFYWIIWGIMFFSINYKLNNGKIRGYIIMAIVLGAVLYAKTFGKFIMYIVREKAKRLGYREREKLRNDSSKEKSGRKSKFKIHKNKSEEGGDGKAKKKTKRYKRQQT